MIRFVNSPKEIDGIEVVQDINEAVKAINEGRTVCRYEWGDSMTPILRHGEYAKLIPISENTEIKRLTPEDLVKKALSQEILSYISLAE